MNAVVIAACFAAALATAMFRGVGAAFAWVYLPALVLLSSATPVVLPGLPDASPDTASVYGILLGSLLAGRWPRLRPTPIDLIFVLLLVTYIASAVKTEYLYTGVNIFGSLFLQLLAPYFIVRCFLARPGAQRSALDALVCTSLVVALFAVIEFRLWPNTYVLLLKAVGVSEFRYEYAYFRFGFFRAKSSFYHPIDLGIGAGLMFAAMAILATRSGVGLRRPWIRLGLGASLVASLCSISFTSYLGLLAAVALYVALANFAPARRMAVSGVVVLILAGVVYAARLASEAPAEWGSADSALAESLRIRQLIAHQSWGLATSAGLLGWGREVDIGDLKSIDNAYLLIAITRGWIALGLWLALPVCLAVLVTRSVRRPQPRANVQAILCGFCAAVGTMVAMFTVWFGFAYASLFMVVLGLTVNAMQAVPVPRRSRAKARPAAQAVQRVLRAG